jgi:hypothetical protein
MKPECGPRPRSTTTEARHHCPRVSNRSGNPDHAAASVTTSASATNRRECDRGESTARNRPTSRALLDAEPEEQGGEQGAGSRGRS